MGRPDLSIGFRCFVLMRCALAISVASAFVPLTFYDGALRSSEAYAITVSASYPSENVPTNPAPIAFQFDHNVGGEGVFGANQTLFYIVGSDGSSPGFSIYCDFSGYTPSIDNPDAPGDRRIIYLQPGSLSPGVTYTAGCMAGVRSQGGHVYPAYSLTFTTAGSAQEPEPSDGALAGTGGGDGGGAGSGSGAGAGQDSGSGAAGSVDSLKNAVGAGDSASTAMLSSGGSGSGKVYLLDDTSAFADDEAPQDLMSISQIILLAAAALVIVMTGAFKRSVLWIKRTNIPAQTGR